MPLSFRQLAKMPRLTAILIIQSLAGLALAAPASRPNILLTIADDLGYGDLACYGHPEIKTPNLDRLAAEGLRLTACYSAAANCSPARAALMTGRTPYRVGIYHQLPMMTPMHLRPGEITIASLLKKAGYATPAGLANFELYDLEADPRESRDRVASQPEVFGELRRKLEKMHASVQAESPAWPLWVDPRDEQARIKWPDYVAKPLR